MFSAPPPGRRRSPVFSLSFIGKLFLRISVVLFTMGVLSAAAAAGLFFRFASELPPVDSLQSYNPSLVTKVFAADDTILGEFYVERRILVPLERMPDNLQKAVLAVEDADFFRHRGLDVKAIARAFVKNLRAGGIIQGGSTITQQVARAMFLSPERRMTRKIKEAILAFRIEEHFSKDDILGLYLNHIYLGHGAYGMEAAALTYFGKTVEELDLLECATLAGLPKAPNHYSPIANPERARTRARHVITRMMDEGYISADEAARALQSPLRLGSEKKAVGLAPYLVENVRRYLQQTYGYEGLYQGGLQAYTTIEPSLQRIADEAVRKGLLELDKRRGYRGPRGRLAGAELEDLDAYLESVEDWPAVLVEGEVYPAVVLSVEDAGAEVRAGPAEGSLPLKHMKWVLGKGREKKVGSAAKFLQPGDLIDVLFLETDKEGKHLFSLEQEPEVEGALICQDVKTGAVLAMVGGYDFGRSQFNRATQARRQPGSAFKPFVYARALEEGKTPASIFIDSPIVYENRDEEEKLSLWKPENYEEHFFGATRLRVALNHSRNVVTVKLLRDVGISDVTDLARRMGVRSPLAQDLTLALGSSGVTLEELTAAYGTFANQGVYQTPFSLVSVSDRDGNILETHHPEALRVLDRQTAYVMTSMLQTVVSDGTGWRVKALGRPIAGKTGTTNDYGDAWFLGYSPELVTGVWVGMDQKESLGTHETGSRAAIPIWLHFMKGALKDLPASFFPVPPGIVFSKIDPATGLLAREDAANALFEVFREGTEPKEVARPEEPKATDFYRYDL
jgi:penicillin-binding protein 1A